MATIRKRLSRGKTVYQVQVRVSGNHSSGTFGSRSDAQKWAADEEIRLKTGNHGIRSRTTNTLREFVNEYLKLPQISTTTASFLKTFLTDQIVGKPITSITVQDAIAYKTRRLERIKPHSLARELSPVRKMWAWVTALYDVPGCPFDKLGVSKKRTRRLRRLTKFENEIITTGTDKINDICQFAIETAMRRGEIARVRIEHVSGRELHIAKTKTDEERTIPLTKKAVSIIHKYAEGRQKGSLFGVCAGWITLKFVELKKANDIEGLHFHDLRHEALSRQDEAGLSIGELQIMSGHKSIAMLGIYIHGVRKNILRKMDKEYEQQERV